MSMRENLDRWLEGADGDPERENPEHHVEGEEDARSAVDEALPARDEDEVDRQREHSESDDPQP